MIEIVTPAWSMPQSMPPKVVWSRAATSISGSVKAVSLLIITSAPRNSFQDVTNANSATVTIAGTTAGRKIRTSTCKELAPSVTAASSSSWGTASKLLRMMYRLNGSWMTVCTMARPRSVLVSRSCANIRKIGVSSAWYGMISARSRKTNSSSLPGMGNRASAVAGGDGQREREERWPGTRCRSC